MTPLLHTPEEAAERLRCKASWLREKARRREIPFSLVGGAYRFSDAHLARIIQLGEQQAQPDTGQRTPAAPRRRTASHAASSGSAVLTARPSKRLRAAP